jgi:hypothetical protein
VPLWDLMGLILLLLILHRHRRDAA